MLYAALYHKDNCWYRAQACDFDKTSISVVYLDFGNRDNVHPAELHSLDSQFRSLPFQGVRCSLAGVAGPEDGVWSAEAVAFFKEWLKQASKGLRAKVVQSLSNWSLQLEVWQADSDVKESVNKTMIGKGYAGTRDTPVPKQAVKKQEEEYPGKYALCPTPPRPGPVRTGELTSPPASSADVPRHLKLTDLPPLPLPSTESIQVCVTDAPSPDCIFVQVLDGNQAEQIAKLEVCLQETYQHHKGSHVPTKGEVVAAVFQSFWCRAEVLDIVDQQSIRVRFLDYGNLDIVPLSEVAALTDELTQFAIQGLHCRLAGVEGPSCDRAWQPSCLTGLDPPLEMQIVKKDGTLPAVNLLDHGESINDRLIAEGLVKASTAEPAGSQPALQDEARQADRLISKEALVVEPEVKPQQKPSRKTAGGVTVPALQLPSDEQEVRVIITSATSPSAVFAQVVHTAEQVQQVDQLLHEMNSKYAGHPGGFKPQVGDIVAAQFSDGGYYRAQVLKMSPDLAEVYFIDYGNRETCQLSQMVELDAEFMRFPIQGLECSLSGTTGVAAGQTWDKSILVNRVMTLKIVDHASQPVAVTLSSDGQDDVVTALIQEGVLEEKTKLWRYADLKQEVLPAGEYMARVTDVPDPQGFVVQVIEEPYLSTLQALERTLEEVHSDYTGRYGPKASELICARFSEDLKWYRAVVLEVLGQKARVRFIDYGNQEVVEDDRMSKFSEQLQEFPIQGVLCCFQGVSLAPGSKWPGSHIELFSQWRMVVEGTDAGVCSVDLLSRENVSMIQHLLKERVLAKVGCISPNRDSAGKDGRQTDFSRQQQRSSSGERQRDSPRQQQRDSPGQQQKQKAPARRQQRDSPENISDNALAFFAAACLSREELTATEKGQVLVVPTFIETCSTFYVHSACEPCFGTATKFAVTFNQHYQGQPRDTKCHSAQVGELIAAYHPEDGAWYRAEVLQLQRQKAKVLYVDLGKAEVADTKHFRKLAEGFQGLPAQARKCILIPALKVEDHNKAKECLSRYFHDKPCQLQVEELRDDVYYCNDVICLDGNISAVDCLMTEGMIPWQASRPGVESTKAATAAGKPWQDIPEGPLNDGVVCFSHINSLSDFYVQPVNEEALAFGKQRDRAHSKALSDPVVYTPGIGESVMALFQGTFDRAGVLEQTNDGSYRVFFFDFGNTDLVAAAEIRKLDQAFAQYPRLARACRLAGVHDSQAGTEWLKKFGPCELLCEVLEGADNNTKHLVELTGERGVGSKLHEEMISQGLAMPTASPQPGSARQFHRFYQKDLVYPKLSAEVQARVIHLDHPAQFYCQEFQPSTDGMHHTSQPFP